MGRRDVARAGADDEPRGASRHAHPLLTGLAAALARRPGIRVVPRSDEPAPRRAAVALALREALNGQLELLLIKRAEYAGDPWSGQVALPGGRHEPADPSLEATAVRETFEETGVDLATSGTLLGTLDEIYPRTPVLPPIVVRPHVFAVTRPVELTLSDEVAAAFWIPVEWLRDPAASVETTVVVRDQERRVSCFRHGEHVIWGLTERVLRQLVELTR
jgi:8-oxo-dGTP pyrophosphatase MutT (NUDIX family)